MQLFSFYKLIYFLAEYICIYIILVSFFPFQVLWLMFGFLANLPTAFSRKFDFIIKN